jgi:uncharacterized protein (UPF0128 family)
VTDERFQYVLEGYSLSNTQDSRRNYKYTEYVEKSEKVYLITETTTVTITVNPNNRRLYTHAQMRNGNYYVRAYSTDINLGAVAAAGLPGEIWQLEYLPHTDTNITLKGCLLDRMQIQVVGSIFDDPR